MDTEKSGEVLGASETPQQEETAVEKEAVETPVESTEPEKSPAAEETTGQMAVNGHQSEAINVKETEELIGTMPEENDPAEKSDADSVPGAKALQQPEESSEKKISEQQPVPENDPESLALQTPLAESAPEPEPAKAAESVPEIKGQTLPESAVVQPPGPTEKEQAKTEKDVQKMDTGAEGDASAKPKEKEEAKPEETVVESEKTAEAQMVMAEASAEVENVKPESEEDVVPAAGSLSFAFLEQEQTKDALRISRTLLVLRGLPGSGKSFLARAIADTYKDHCIVISADDYGIKPEKPESCADGYKALDEAVVARCADGNASPVLVVVDDTHHTQDRLARLGEIAEQQDLVALFLEPQTEWRRDLALLTKKTKRGLEEAHLAAMKGPLEEVSIPLYFGWFLLFSVKNKIKCTSMDFLKTLDTLDAFKKHSVDFTGKAEKEVDLEQYFKPAGILHCTTKFCDYGKAEGAKEYAENQAVIKSYGSISDLSLGAFFVTPRTCGARVSLTDEQLQLWPADAEKQAEPVPEAAASLPLGSRAHITLGCAEGVEPVQTGIDLLEILAQQASQQGELVEEMELGSLTYYGEGKWLLNLREPICVPACFSSMYGRKEPEPTKKDPEKKKKPKCAIL